MNRKKAAAFAIGVAGERKMSFGGSGVLLGANKQTPLVVRKSGESLFYGALLL